MNVKSLWLAAATVLLLGAGTGNAQQQQFPPMPGQAPMMVPMWSGYASGFLGGSWSRQEQGGPIRRDTAFVFGGDARANLSFFPGFHLQLDVEGERANGAYNCCNATVRSYFAFDAHVSYRDPERFSLGGFGGYVVANNLDDLNTAQYAMFGAEGQIFLPGVTLYGQGGYIALLRGKEDLQKTGFGRAAVRWFPDPNFKVAGELDYARGELHDDTFRKMNILSWGGSLEKRFTGTMFSVFANYNGVHMESPQSKSDRARDHTVVVGVRIFGNQPTLYANDRTGATYDKPNFLRYLPWVGEAD